MPVPGVLVLTRNGIRWQFPHTFGLACFGSWSPSMWNSRNPCFARSESSSVYARFGAGGYGTPSRYHAMSSRSRHESSPGFPSSFLPVSPTRRMVDANPPSIRWRVALVGGSSLLFGSTALRVLAEWMPP